MNRKRNPAFRPGLALASVLILGCMAPGWAAIASTDLARDALNNPSPPVANPEHVVILAVTRAGNRLVAVGEHGVITLSDDNGKRWRQAEVPVDVSLTAVRFADDRTGWAVGHLGVILKTADGGEHWALQLDGISGARLAMEEAEADAKAAQTETKAGAAEGDPIKQELRAAKRLEKDGPDKPLLNLLVTNDQQVLAVGAFNLAFRTADGGKTWQYWSSHVDNMDGSHLYAIRSSAVSGEVFIAGERGLLLRSGMDEGHFTSIVSPYSGSLFVLLEIGDGKLFLGGLSGNAFYSGDNGASWKAAQIEWQHPATLNGGIVLSDHIAVVCDQAGRLLASRDGGQSWAPTSLPAGAPCVGVAEAADQSLVLATMAGLRVVPRSVVDGPKSIGGASE
jgi:photosystem II stability/assembly factor-like uncharacterized protein